MAVTIQDDMWEAACTLPEDQRRAFIDALLRFAFDGEEPDHAAPWYGIFVACRGRISMSAKRSRDGQEAASRQWGKKKASSNPSEDSDETQKGSEVTPSEGTHEGSDSDTQNAEMRRDEVSRGEKEITSGTPDESSRFTDEEKGIADSVIARLNDLTHQSYRSRTKKALRPIAARLREGFSAQDLVLVVENQSRLWLRDQKMRAYLRPETLFGPKFEGYLNAAKMTDGGVSHADATAYDQGISLVAF